MTQKQTLTDVLDELKKLTGVSLQLTDAQSDDEAYAASQLSKLCNAYKEKFDRTHFLRELLCSSLSTYEIDERAERLHIKTEENRVLFLLESAEQTDNIVTTILNSLFPPQTGTFIFSISETQTAVIQPISDTTTTQQLTQLSHSIVDTLNAEALISVKVAYSSPFSQLSDLSDAYTKNHLALRIGQLFTSGQTVFSYQQLGVGRLIYQLPNQVCEDFLNEVFKGQIPETLEAELISTVNRFFLNNLNIAETARQLHMHRNTLIYRLEQIQKKTGLDLRNFEDAITFKIALMVWNYRNVN